MGSTRPPVEQAGRTASHRNAPSVWWPAPRTPPRCCFQVAVAEDAYLQLDDVVLTDRDVPGFGPVSTAGVVTEVRARHEGA